MQELNIRLRRTEGERTLSVEINGRTYDSVDIEFAKELVKRALIEAEEYLNKSATRRTQ